MKFAVVLVILWATGAALTPMAIGGPEDDAKVTLDIQGASLADAIAQVSKAGAVTILTDGEISRSGIQLSVTDAPIETALAAICAPHQLAWKRLYVKADPQKKLKGEGLGNLIRALEAIQKLDLVAIDGKTNLSTVYVRDAKVPLERLTQFTGPDAGCQLVYLIVDLKPKPKPKESAGDTAKQSAVDKILAQQRQSMDVLRTMTPQQLDEYFARQADYFRTMDTDMQAGFITMGMRMFLGMDPADAQEVFMKAMSNLTPDELDALRRMGGPRGGPPE